MRVRDVTWLAGAIALLAAAPVGAQALASDPVQSSEQTESEVEGAESDIVVEAPRFLPVPPENLPTEPMTKALATVKIYVLYEDLDLTRPADAGRLMERVDQTARQACDYLDKLYPLDDDPDCVKRAAGTATPAAKAAIAAAKGDAAPTDKQP